MQLKNDFVHALLKEVELQKNYLEGEEIETIYFGGGTPSLLSGEELSTILAQVRATQKILSSAEITLEANPDDITREKLMEWKSSGINRLSIGIQSFFEDDLLWMNRAHTASQSIKSLELARQAGFENITIDLIYGHPGLTDDKWKSNLERAIGFEIPHLSCYALTVEPKTALAHLILKKESENVNPDDQARQFNILLGYLEENGFEQYEVSNFAKPGHRSLHNTSYWQQKKYLGLGPSAHSFNLTSRQWNVANNKIYIDSLAENKLSFELENLTPSQRINEYIMTSLRTIEGLDLGFVQTNFGEKALKQLVEDANQMEERGLIELDKRSIRLTRKGKFLADGIAANLFFEML